MILKNLIFNAFSRFINLASNYFFIPLYIYFLGVENYGIIGFYILLFSILLIFDLGITATATRQMAINLVNDDGDKAKKTLLSSFEIIYAFICFFCLIALISFIDFIGNSFINSDTLGSQQISRILLLMSFALCFQLPTGLYIGAMMGMERQMSANLIISFGAIFRGFLGVLFLWQEPSLESFFISQIIANFIILILLRIKCWSFLHRKSEYFRFSKSIVFKNIKFAAGMTGLSLLGIIISQADKAIISSSLDLKSFSFYILAFNVAAIPLMVAQILSLSTYPRLVAVFHDENKQELQSFYTVTSHLCAIAILSVAMTLIFFNQNFSFLWLGDPVITQEIKWISIILIVSQTLQALTMLPYNYALSRGITHVQTKIAIFSLILLIPCLLYATPRFGLIGAASVFCMIQALVFPINIILLHQSQDISINLRSTYLVSIFKNFFIIVPPIAFFAFLMKGLSVENHLINFSLLVSSFSLSFVIAFIANKDLMNRTQKYIKAFLS